MPHTRLIDRPPAPGVPAYDGLQDAFHRAFRPELRRVIEDLPLGPAASVLDAPCGDGFYAALLARRLGPGGSLTAADRSRDYLDRARAAVAAAAPRADAVFVGADAYRLPFPEASFDLVWCAQSLISLGDPAAAVRELGRVVRPGGCVAVLENDAFHHVLLPWPVELEAALHRAILLGGRRRYGRGGRLHPARKLRQLFAAAGLRPQRKKTYPADRLAPFGDDVRAFLRFHLRSLRSLAADFLPDAQRERFDRLTDEEDPSSLLRREDVELTCLNTLLLGQR
jgi:ubiquinone/menaquinone biosynthesis C-methylase UbiE